MRAAVMFYVINKYSMRASRDEGGFVVRIAGAVHTSVLLSY